MQIKCQRTAFGAYKTTSVQALDAEAEIITMQLCLK